MNKTKMIVFILILTITGFQINPISASDNMDTDIRFTVEAIIPENQVDQDVSYFHLLLDKKQQQEISVKVTNLKKEPITILASANNARTNSNGVIEYNVPKGTGNATTLQPDFESIVTTKNPRLTLEAYEESHFVFLINGPETEFEGIILGGFNFEMEHDKTDSAGVSQTYSYSISTVLSQEEAKLSSSKKLDFVGISPIVNDGFKYLNVQLKNLEPRILSDLDVDVKIYPDNSDVMIYSKQSESMEIAPHSSLDYKVDTGRKNLASGTYRYVIEASSFKQTWRWENTFTIDDAIADQVNEESINKIIVPDFYKFAITISIVLTLVNAGLIVNETRKKETN